MVRFKLCGAQTTAALWFWEHLWLFISFPPSFDLSNIISCPKIALPIHFQVCLKPIFKHLPKYSLETLLFMSDVLYAQHICLCCQTAFQFLQNFSNKYACNHNIRSPVVYTDAQEHLTTICYRSYFLHWHLNFIIRCVHWSTMENESCSL